MNTPYDLPEDVQARQANQTEFEMLVKQFKEQPVEEPVEEENSAVAEK